MMNGEPPRAQAVSRVPRQDWVSRNWKWFVPLLIGGGLLLVGLFAGGIVLSVFRIMKSSEPYRLALAQVQGDPRAGGALGTPIQPGWYVTGQINVSGPSGKANIAIPITGPRGKATVHVQAVKEMGLWRLTGLVLEMHRTGLRLDLLGKSREQV